MNGDTATTATATTGATTVHNLRRGRPGPGDARIDRATAFGNPFAIGRDGDRAGVIAKFERRERERLRTDPARRRAVAALHGKRLWCWCDLLPCHGHVLARLAAGLVAEGTATG